MASSADGNPERMENAGNAMLLQANSQQDSYESLDGKKLAKCT
jgi:hypothetical protein